MNKQELRIEEGNRLIGKFMGATVFKDKLWFITVESGKFHDGTNAATFDRVAYHSSWDWLMPVVEKVNEICSKNARELSNHSRDQEGLPDPLNNPAHWKGWSSHYIHLSTDIKYVYEQVVKTIQWYNIYTAKQKGRQ